MKLLRLLVAGLLTAALEAAVPPPPQLFPQDTLLLATVPDWTVAQSSLGAAPIGRLWADPAMKPFRTKFETQFREKFLGSLEKDLGIKASEFLPLFQGQISFGALQADWKPSDEDSDPTFVLVVDTRDKSDQLKARLAEVRQRLTEAKKPVRTEKIRDLEFTTVVIEAPANPDDGKDGVIEDLEELGKKPQKMELTFGQADSALVVATATAGLDRIVARLTGGTVPVLGEMSDFQTAEAAAAFRDSVGYVYLQASGVLEALKAGTSGAEGGAFGGDPQQAIAGLGLDGLRSVSGSIRQTEAGLTGRSLFVVPESKRLGLVKLLRFEAKDSAPPAFVPADAIKFERVRINGQQVWAGLEAVVQQVSPQLAALLNMSLGVLGKDKDPSFDFRKQFFGNLGDDYVAFEKSARGKTLADLENRPSLSLLGAVNPTEMLSALRTLSSLLPGGGEDFKEREVEGKKIFSFKYPSGPNQTQQVIEISASGGYVAFANDAAILEEFLRSGDGAVRPLKDLPGLVEAAQAVGGMSTGVFGYQNQRESVQTTWEALRTGGGIEKLIPAMSKQTAADAAEWLDFSLLPPFEQMSKYFGIAVSAGAWNSTGFQLHTFVPTPK